MKNPANFMFRNPASRAELRALVIQWAALHGFHVTISDDALEELIRAIDRRVAAGLKGG